MPQPFVYQPPKSTKNVAEQLRRCQKILGMLQKHKSAMPFLLPVDPIAQGCPDYPIIVKEPMDLSTVEKKLKMGQYVTPLQFQQDVNKIWSNAIRYNPQNNPVYDATRLMMEYFDKIYKEVEDTPFIDYGPEQLQKKVVKVEKKVEEIKSKGTGGSNEYPEMTLDEKKQLTQMIKGRSMLNQLLARSISVVLETSYAKNILLSQKNRSSNSI